ncbi:CPBP family intramembrane glutamic endopeptidase, partial [Metapseudomonas otitidis]|uniref:CPBP family intramembrane glutamic endopeptidase n=1 Tax=Metapseudomonas otitidis TaxID=319939 RepID=UPI00374CF6C8
MNLLVTVLAEELVFRALLQRTLAARLGSRASARSGRGRRSPAPGARPGPRWPAASPAAT